MKKVYVLAASICLGFAANAQDSLKVIQLDDVVVTGNKVETTIEKSGKTIFKLNRKQIEANRGKDVTDLLNEMPGIQIDGNFGTPGTNINYRIRGAQSGQTLILIDGVPFNDPSGLSQVFDLRMLDLDQVESIEVLKGGLSSLYGTGAAAGVISITLKKASQESLSGAANVEYGSFNTVTTSANVSGTSDKLNYLVSGTYKSSNGFSSAQDEDNVGGFDDDGFKSLNFLGKIGYDFTDQFSVGLTAAIDDVDSDFDGGAFTDNDSEFEQKQVRFALSPTYKWTGGSVKGNFTYHTNERTFNSPSFSDPNTRSISEFKGNTFQADVLVDQNLTDEVKLLGGINYQRPVWEPDGADNLDFSIIDHYASFIYDRQNLNVQLGGRLNNHSEYGSSFVWNINPSYLIDLGSSKLKVLGSYSTAFVAPSLSQLFNPSWGNSNLDPQNSESAEGGFEWISDAKFRFGTVYFYRKDKEAIAFLSEFDDGGNFIGGSYVNEDGNTEVDGIELNASYSFTPQVSLSGHYTYTNSKTSDVILRRIPQDKFGFSLSAIPMENLLVKLTHLHVGETMERESIPAFDAYNLFDVSASYSLNNITISGSVNNLFDEEYVARRGYQSIGRNYNLGLRYSF